MFRCNPEDSEAKLRAGLREMGLSATGLERRHTFRHVLTHRNLEVTAYTVEAEGDVESGQYDTVAWLGPEEVKRAGLSTLARKSMAER